MAVEVFLGKLKPEDIKVDVYYGVISPEHNLTDTAIENLHQFTSLPDGKYRFSGALTCKRSGSFGFNIRIILGNLIKSSFPRIESKCQNISFPFLSKSYNCLEISENFWQ